jgi:hypothetical protein
MKLYMKLPLFIYRCDLWRKMSRIQLLTRHIEQTNIIEFCLNRFTEDELETPHNSVCCYVSIKIF